MKQRVATSAQFLVILSQLVASCLGLYYTGAGRTIFDGPESKVPGGLVPLSSPQPYGLVPGSGPGYGQLQGYPSGYDFAYDYIGAYGSYPGYVNGLGLAPNYIGAYDSQPACGTGYGQGISYAGGYDRGQGYGSNIGVPVSSPVGLGTSYGTPVGPGPNYSGGIINEPSFASYGGGVNAYPRNNLAYNPIPTIPGTEVVPTQQQASLTSNENTNTNINVNNNLGKPRRSSLTRAILGIPQ